MSIPAFNVFPTENAFSAELLQNNFIFLHVLGKGKTRPLQ